MKSIHYCRYLPKSLHGSVDLHLHRVRFASLLVVVMSRPIGGHVALMAVVCRPSVCPSVCPLPEPKLRTRGHRELKIDRKEAHDTDDPLPHLE